MITPLDGGIGLLMLAMGMATINSTNPTASLVAFIPYPAIAGLYYWVANVLLAKHLVIKWWPLGWGFLVVTGLAGLVLHRDPRLAGITDSPNTLAVLLNMTLPPTLSRFARKPGLVAVLVTVGLVLATRSRSGLIGLALALAVYYGPGVLRAKRLRRYYLAGGLAVLVAIPMLRPDTVNLLTNGNANRLAFWVVAVQMWQSSPLWGTGPGTFSQYYSQVFTSGFPYASAHNWFMQLLGETGLLGAGGLVTVGVQFFAWLRRRRSRFARKPIMLGWLAGLAAFIWHCQFDTPGAVVLSVAAVITGVLMSDDRRLTSGGRKV